jgi:hypothetical protein
LGELVVAVELGALGFDPVPAPTKGAGASAPSRAEPLIRRALAIFGTSLGPDHPSTATARRNLMGLEAERGKGRDERQRHINNTFMY